MPASDNLYPGKVELLGLERGSVRLAAYDSRWNLLFREMAIRLQDVLGDRILAIEHVGSTAVPGLSAKPILDMLVGIADFDAGPDMVSDLGTLGFEYRPDEEIPDRHYFRKSAGNRRTHHLSLAEPNSRHYRRTLGFRDSLRENPALARSYELLKIELARRYPHDRTRYLAGKTDFVLAVLDSRGLLD